MAQGLGWGVADKDQGVSWAPTPLIWPQMVSGCFSASQGYQTVTFSGMKNVSSSS